MITKVTAANADEFYNPRFAEITAALQAAGYDCVVNSIETYFANLEAISSLTTNKVVGYDEETHEPIYAAGKYLVVPFDEPYFEIDANTRTITVPDHFKKYGVGVLGDNLAEMLVFKVDRYFDHKDLFTANAAITWSFTPKGSRTPIIGTPQAGFAQDDELEPGYVVFGFIITREMAEKADGTLSSGTLTFAVTFYNSDANDEYQYSWNTQPVSVAINEGLELKDATKVKDLSRNIISRIKDSAYTPEGISPLLEPYWLTGDIVEGPADGIVQRTGLPLEADFHMNDDGTEDEILVLSARASNSDSAATIKYRWYAGLNEDDILVARDGEDYTLSTDFMPTEDAAPIEGKTYYIGLTPITAEEFNTLMENETSIFEFQGAEFVKLTADDEAMEAKTYYKQVAENSTVMAKVVTDERTLDAIFNNLAGSDMPVYELGSSYNVNQAGSYQVSAQAEKVISQSSGNITIKSNALNSEVCVVHAAAKPEVELIVETTLADDYDIINPEAAEGLTFIASDSTPRIIANVTSPSGRALGAIALEALNTDNVGELTAQEIIENTRSDSNPEGRYVFELLNGDEDEGLQPGQKLVNTDGVITEGAYVVRAINRRNHSYAVSDASQVIETSFVAPVINGITLTTVDGSTQVVLLDKGQKPINPETNEREGAIIRLNQNYQERIFTLVDESENNIDGATPMYFLEEVIQTPTGYEKKNPRDEADQIVEYEIVEREGGALECVVNDEGFYRVRVENIYKGTRRIGYTDVFEVLRLV